MEAAPASDALASNDASLDRATGQTCLAMILPARTSAVQAIRPVGRPGPNDRRRSSARPPLGQLAQPHRVDLGELDPPDGLVRPAPVDIDAICWQGVPPPDLLA